jgi:hypothetical protein
MTSDYLVLLKPHLGTTKHVIAMERFEIGVMRPEVMREIMEKSNEMKDPAEIQAIAIDAMLRDLPNTLVVQFSNTFREVTIKDKHEKILVSGRGIGPEGAMYNAYIKFWKYAKKEVGKHEDTNEL